MVAETLEKALVDRRIGRRRGNATRNEEEYEKDKTRELLHIYLFILRNNKKLSCSFF